MGDGNDVDSGVYGHLYGVGPDVPGGSENHYSLSAHRLCTYWNSFVARAVPPQ